VRILYLHQYFVSPEAAGGTRSYELARRLVEAGHEVTLVTSNAMMPARYHGISEPLRTEMAGIDLVVLPVRYGNAMGYAERMRAFARFAALASVEALRHRSDVVFATSTPLTIALPGLLASFGRRIPMVFEVRDLWPELPIAMGALPKPWMRAAARTLEWLAYHGSAHVVALSPGIAAGVEKTGIARDRISVIPNACDLEMFASAPVRAAGVRAEHLPWLRSDDRLVLYAGTFGAINDAGWLADVAEAARSIAPQLSFALVGGGAERDAIEARARARGVLGTNLRMLPPVAKRDMPGLLGAATIATSLFKPLPEMEANSANKFFDALAAGRPIAINYGGWHADLLRSTGAGLVLPHADPRAAAERLAALALDDDAVARAGAAASALARERFDRDRLAVQLEDVLERAAVSKGSTRGVARVFPSARAA
jgi:glycosyltransferase involved in cell wall biosynthesis